MLRRKEQIPASGYLLKEEKDGWSITLPETSEEEYQRLRSNKEKRPVLELVDDATYNFSGKLQEMEQQLRTGVPEKIVRKEKSGGFSFSASNMTGDTQWRLPAACPRAIAEIIAKAIVNESKFKSMWKRSPSIDVRISHKEHAEAMLKDAGQFHTDGLGPQGALYIVCASPTTQTIEGQIMDPKYDRLPKELAYAEHPISSLLPWRLYRCDEREWTHATPDNFLEGNEGGRFFLRIKC